MLNEVVYEGNHAKVIKMFDDLYFREANLEIRGQCNSGYVKLKDSAAIIDYSEQWPDEEIIEEAEELLKKPVKYIFVTHAHGDHFVGFRSLHRRDISVIASEASLSQIKAEGCPIPNVFMSVTKSVSLDLEGVKFELIMPGRISHSPYDMPVGIPAHKALFPGDLVVLQKNMYFHTSEIGGWRKTVADLQRMDWEWLCRGHGPIVGSEYFDEAAKYLELLERAKLHQAKFNEPVDERAVHSGLQTFSDELRGITDELLKSADAVNIARQLNQLMLRTAEGY